MIARIWRGRTAEEDADAYLEYLYATGVKDYRETEGNIGVYVLRRFAEGEAEFVLLSLWESVDAIRRFAGEDYELAVYYRDDERFLLSFEPRVEHYQVLS